MPRTIDRQFWLSRFAWLCVFATLSLIFLGGMVTSKQAGLAVPDWPLSYGSVNPPGWWHIENVRLEHGHRLIGSVIGMLTIGLVIATWKIEPRRWVRWLSVGALVGVIVQGVMGGLRVTERSTFLAILHGCTAQAFLCVLVVLAVVMTPRWITGRAVSTRPVGKIALVVALVVYAQLIVGAVMRHMKAGLAIPDFPLAFGQVIPPLNTFPVIIHFAHRVGALAVCAAVVSLLVIALRGPARDWRFARPALLIMALVIVQVCLGASVIWLAKAPVPTTFHVLNGAAILAVAVSLVTRSVMLAAPALRVDSTAINPVMTRSMEAAR